MSSALTNPSVELPINEETARLVRDLIGPKHSLVAMIAIEEMCDIIICRSRYYYDMIVMTGDLADLIFGDNFFLEDAIATCELFGLPYHVEM